MEQLTLSVEKRETKGKGPARRLRMEGKVPGVLYGHGDHLHLTVSPKLIERTLRTEGGRNKVFTIDGGGLSGKKALIQDLQVDPVSQRILHVDLYEIDATQTVDVDVKLNFTGKSVGVVEGGILNVIEREVYVKCLPDKIPEHIDVDVTPLAIGESIHFNEIKLPEGVEAASDANPTLVTVVPPAKEEELTPALDAAAEPEVITEKKDAEGDAKEGGDAGDKDKK